MSGLRFRYFKPIRTDNLDLSMIALSVIKVFKYVHLPADVPFSIPMEMTKYKCLILIEREVSNDYRNEVSAALVAAGCLYALAWGLDCSLWDDAIDWAFLEHYGYGEYPEDRFLMPTWHDDETLEETLDFAKHCLKYSDVKLDDILVLDFTKHERSDFIERLYFNK